MNIERTVGVLLAANGGEVVHFDEKQMIAFLKEFMEERDREWSRAMFGLDCYFTPSAAAAERVRQRFGIHMKTHQREK